MKKKKETTNLKLMEKKIKLMESTILKVNGLSSYTHKKEMMRNNKMNYEKNNEDQMSISKYCFYKSRMK